MKHPPLEPTILVNVGNQIDEEPKADSVGEIDVRAASAKGGDVGALFVRLGLVIDALNEAGVVGDVEYTVCGNETNADDDGFSGDDRDAAIKRFSPALDVYRASLNRSSLDALGLGYDMLDEMDWVIDELAEAGVLWDDALYNGFGCAGVAELDLTACKLRWWVNTYES